MLDNETHTYLLRIKYETERLAEQAKRETDTWLERYGAAEQESLTPYTSADAGERPRLSCD